MLTIICSICGPKAAFLFTRTQQKRKSPVCMSCVRKAGAERRDRERIGPKRLGREVWKMTNRAMYAK